MRQNADRIYQKDCYILPCDRVAVVGRESTVIYSIPIDRGDSGKSWTPLHTIPLRTNPTALLGKVRSPVVVNATMAIVLYAIPGSLVAVKIPHDRHAEPSVMEMLQFLGSSKEARVIGLHSSVMSWREPYHQGRTWSGSLT